MTEVYLCEGCRQEIDPGGPDTVPAVEMVRSVAMGPTVEYLPGRPVLFHEHCYPEGSPGYRRRDLEK